MTSFSLTTWSSALTSQFRSKLKGEGGVAGHAVMYIKGACKDEQAPFPLLRRCRVAATELNDPEHGAGVSVGRTTIAFAGMIEREFGGFTPPSI